MTKPLKVERVVPNALRERSSLHQRLGDKPLHR
jgi:hypothetical protein